MQELDQGSSVSTGLEESGGRLKIKGILSLFAASVSYNHQFIDGVAVGVKML